MQNSYVSSLAESLVKRFKSRDPFYIARELGIDIEFMDLGSLKGMYTVIKRNRFIVINPDCDENTRRLVCAHELGHDRLHHELAADTAIREFVLYDMKSKPEYEANVFACQLLLDPEEVFDCVKQGMSAEQTASHLGTDVNLVRLKLELMNREGYPVRCGDTASSRFLA